MAVTSDGRSALPAPGPLAARRPMREAFNHACVTMLASIQPQLRSSSWRPDFARRAP